METKKKVLVLFVSLVIVTAVLLFGSKYLGQGDSKYEGDARDLAKYLTEKGVVMYGLETCPHCQDQKKMFGEDFKYVNYTSCEKDVVDCAKLKGVPAWKKGDKIIYGAQSFAELQKFADS